MATTMLSPLASVTDFTDWGSNSELVQETAKWTTAQLQKLMLRASRAIENRCQRRLAPFANKFESHRAEGIAPDEYGAQGDMPMDLTGALGWSQAAALGVSDMVREFWLDESAPMFQELWTYTMQRVEFLRTFGDTQTFLPSDLRFWQGPESDTGHIKMPIGLYCPIGTTIRAWYSGGYTVEIPDDLNYATVLQATKIVLLGAEPEQREKMSQGELDEEILLTLTPYVR